MKESFDAIVIGSGFGGAIIACRLAQAGLSVCVLEQGRWWQKEAFPRAIGQVGQRLLFEPGEQQGFIELKTFKEIDVIQGIGVGGGSLHYFNVHIRAKAKIYEQPEWPTEITRSVLDPYHDLAKDMLDAQPLQPPAGRELPPRTTQYLEAASKAGGRDPKLMDIAVYSGEDRTNPHGNTAQRACEYCGNCGLGCHVHAKNTLDLNYIPLAQAHGAEIRSLHRAEKIAPHTDGGYTVEFDRLDGETAKKVGSGRIFGRKIIVAAGTVGSNQLLLNCRDVHRTLPNLSATLGERFSGNGDYILGGTIETDKVVDPAVGPSITAGADFSTAEHEIYIQDVGYPDQLLWYVEGMLPDVGRIGQMLHTAKNYLATRLGRGEPDSTIRYLDALLDNSKTKHLMPYLGMGSDSADGKFSVDADGEIDLDWSVDESKAMFNAMRDAMKRLSKAQGGKFYESPLWHWPLRKTITAHPLGGCVVSDSAAKGVVNPQGEVWNYPDLYIADGSIIPTALVVNPTATICALAERVAFHIIHNREMQPSDPDTPSNQFPVN